MDSYVAEFQAAGGSLVMLAKGNRSRQVTEACAAHGGFYLGSIGGPAARLAQDCIRKVEVLEYPELGMEAVWRSRWRTSPPSSSSTTRATTSSTSSARRWRSTTNVADARRPLPCAAWRPGTAGRRDQASSTRSR